jgi:hypothetical protein
MNPVANPVSLLRGGATGGREMTSGEIRIDDRLESYKSFFDHAWAEGMFHLVDGTKLAEPVFLLLMNWRATANTHLLPWLMIHSIRGFEKGYLRPKEGLSEKIIRGLMKRIPDETADFLSMTSRKKLAKVIRKLGEQLDEVHEVVQDVEPEEMNVNKLFGGFIWGHGGSEMQFSLWGSQRICYGAVFHAYEDFITQCVGLARNDPDYQVFKWKSLASHAKDAFGQAIADYCLTDQPVEIARLVRNRLAHNGGKICKELEALPHGIEVANDILQIKPVDNHKLFAMLKERVRLLAEAAIKVPHLALASS